MIDDFEIGYKRPPSHTKFKKGVSGNPKGRPRGNKNVDEVIYREIMKLVSISENGKKIKVPMLVGILKKASLEVMNGNEKFLKIYLAMFNNLKNYTPPSRLYKKSRPPNKEEAEAAYWALLKEP